MDQEHMDGFTHSSPQHVVWKCLDTLGMDACRFSHHGDGWQISGTAIHRTDDTVANLAYQVECDANWNCHSACVTGWLGSKNLHFDIQRGEDGLWMLNRVPIAKTESLLDLDLGFTPATNTNAIRRLLLQPGQSMETAALWLDTGDWSLKPLRQIYQCVTAHRYIYSSPDNDYQSELVVDDFSVVTLYPNLWEAID